MSNLITDVVGIWTNTRSTVETGRAEGRGRREWLTVIGIYILLTVALSVFAKLIGSDKLLDHFLGEDTSLDDWKLFSYLTGGIIVFVAIFGLCQWAFLPRVSGWFGGSRARSDATIAYYFFVCSAVLLCVLTVLLDLLSVGLQQIALPLGSYLHLVWLCLMLMAAAYISGRIVRTAQSVPGLKRSIGVAVVSFLLAVIVIALVAMFFIAIFYPDLLETSP